MKKYFLLVWLLAIALVLTSCIQGSLEAEGNAPPTADTPPTSETPPSDGEPSDSDTQTPPENTPAPLPEKPIYTMWAGDDLTANFFLNTAGIVDTSRAEYS